MTAIEDHKLGAPPRVALYRNPRLRGIFLQGIFLLALLWIAYEFVGNVRANLQAQKITTGFEFLGHVAGFDVSQSLIPYQVTDSYRRLFFVGLLNTLLVSGLGILLATILGLVVGIARLSSNWLISRLAGLYVEVIRNQPLLFQILFWYLAVLGTLPGPRQSLSIFGEIFLNNRGIVVPRPLFAEGTVYVGAALALGIVAALSLRYWARRRQAATGELFSLLGPSLGLVVGLPLAAAVVAGFPISFEHPQLTGFNFTGGLRIIPEFAALLIALATYTAAFIAEIVRAGILAVPRGQTEAAYSLGLPPGLTTRLVVMPQALRVIVPPLTSQYLNLTKNSSLAVGIGYPDLFAVFAGTALNQTGQAIEIIAITMATYLALSLITSLLMNIYAARTRLAER
jgi:general L-amino acid transport system permease protein